MRVKIYQDPITQKDFEGEAEIVKYYRRGRGETAELLYVKVRFDGETETHLRWIRDPEKKETKP